MWRRLRIYLFPGFNHSGVIPPYLASPTLPGGSPYLTDLCTVVAKLGTTTERRGLIRGLLNYRAALRAVGVTSGFQLLDGSFTEDCEAIHRRPPGDIDVVTYGHLPVSPAQVRAFMATNINLFDTAQTKSQFSCDAYFVDMAKAAELVVDDTFYWHGLFSHQRGTAMWKGMLRIPLMADDIAAHAALTALAGAAIGP